MKVLVIGAGMMGSAMAYDLAHSPSIEEIFLADIDAERAKKVAASIGASVKTKTLDTGNKADVLSLMRAVNVAIGATLPR